MPLTEGSQSATEQWEVFALALAGTLLPFKAVHVAPRFSRRQLNNALATYLTLSDDELLLALIDSGRRSSSCQCALTTRRVYWTAIDDLGEGNHDDRSKRWNRRARHNVVLRIAAYEDLPDQITVIRRAGAIVRPRPGPRYDDRARTG